MNQEPMRQENDPAEAAMHNDRIFYNNPVFMQGLGLAPVVVAATTLQNALVLGFAALLLLTPTRVIAAALTDKMHTWFRGVVYALTSAVVYIAVWFAVQAVFGLKAQAVGLYLPLLVVEPIILKRYERAPGEKTPAAVRKGLVTTAGFELALFLTAFLRELFGAGTLMGNTVSLNPALPMLQLTCGGFLLVGTLMALWRWFRNLHKRYGSMGAGVK